MGTKLDNKKTLLEHQFLIKEKFILKKIYTNFYQEMRNLSPKGKIVELGSGGGFIKEIIPQAITTDVIKGPNIDLVFSGTKIPLDKNSVASFLMLDVLHHIKNPEQALMEMERCLKVGGKIIMIEPYNSFWSRFIYKNFHHEGFDPRGNWKVKGSGRLSNANMAVPWIIFKRDRELFEKKFPNLKIIQVTPHTPFLYLFSGGLSKPQLIPSFLVPLIQYLENYLRVFNPLLGMFATIELKKIS